MEDNTGTPPPEEEKPVQPEEETSAGPPPPEDEDVSSTGLDPNLAALICYLLGIVGGIIFYIIEKESKFVKFHAMQSILLSVPIIVVNIAYFILSFIELLACILTPLILLINLAFLVISVLMMVKAYQGEYYKLPIIGDLAEQQVK